MRRSTVIGLFGLLVALLLVAASPLTASAATTAFGARLTVESEPTGRESCDQNAGIPNHASCTWVATTAFENGDHFKAPKDGTIGKVKLISCVSGSFTLQLARVRNNNNQAKVVHSGPTISYQADPRQTDGNPDTFCGGDNFDDFIIQTFNVNVPIHKGDYIGVKAAKIGFIHNSGGGNDLLFAPPLSSGGGFKTKDGDSSADLMLRLLYK